MTGFALLGHGFEMAQGSGCTVHIQSGNVPFHPEAWDLAAMGLIPAGAYRNRDYAEKGVTVRGNVSRTMQDLLYDPQTSGGLLMAVDPADAEACLRELRDAGLGFGVTAISRPPWPLCRRSCMGRLTSPRTVTPFWA